MRPMSRGGFPNAVEPCPRRDGFAASSRCNCSNAAGVMSLLQGSNETDRRGRAAERDWRRPGASHRESDAKRFLRRARFAGRPDRTERLAAVRLNRKKGIGCRMGFHCFTDRLTFHCPPLVQSALLGSLLIGPISPLGHSALLVRRGLGQGASSLRASLLSPAVAQYLKRAGGGR